MGVYIYNTGDKNAASEPVNDFYDTIKGMTERDRGIALSRIDAMKDGVKTLHKNLGGGVSELKLNDTTRIYYTVLGDPEKGGHVVVLYASKGKDNGNQQEAIEKAKEYRQDLMERVRDERADLAKAPSRNGAKPEITDERVLDHLLRPANTNAMAESMARKPSRSQQPQQAQQQQAPHQTSESATTLQDAQRAEQAQRQEAHGQQRPAGNTPPVAEPHPTATPAERPHAGEGIKPGSPAAVAVDKMRTNPAGGFTSGAIRALPIVQGILNVAEFKIMQDKYEQKIHNMQGKDGIPKFSEEAMKEYGMIGAGSHVEEGMSAGQVHAFGVSNFIEWGKKNHLTIDAMEKLNPTGASTEQLDRAMIQKDWLRSQDNIAQTDMPHEVKPLATPGIASVPDQGSRRV